MTSEAPWKMLSAGRTVYRNGSWCRPQPRWFSRLRVGDVITNGGAWRVVRAVSRYQNADLRSVRVVIQRCSWTHRCYTVLNAVDLRTFGYRLVPVKRRRLNKQIDKRIHIAIHEPGTKKSLTCCDVEGVA